MVLAFHPTSFGQGRTTGILALYTKKKSVQKKSYHYLICLVHKEKVGPKKSYYYLICLVHKEKVGPNVQKVPMCKSPFFYGPCTRVHGSWSIFYTGGPPKPPKLKIFGKFFLTPLIFWFFSPWYQKKFSVTKKKTLQKKIVRGGGRGVANPLQGWTIYPWSKPSAEPLQGFYLGDPYPIHISVGGNGLNWPEIGLNWPEIGPKWPVLGSFMIGLNCQWRPVAGENG